MNTLINIGIWFGLIVGSYLFLCIVFWLRKRHVTREAMKMIKEMQKYEKSLMETAHSLSPQDQDKEPKK